MANETLGALGALLSALGWAAAVVLFKRSGETIPPLALNVFKNTIGLALLLLTTALLGLLTIDAEASDWLALLASGAAGISLADTLFFASLNRLGAGRSAIVDSLYAPFVVTSGWLMLGERLALRDGIGAALVVAGVLLTTRRGTRDTPDARNVALGVLYGVLAMGTMAVAIVAVKPILERQPVLWTTTVRMVGGFVPLLVVAALHRPSRQAVRAAFLPSPGWRFAVPASVIGSYLAVMLWIAGYKYSSAGAAAILNQTSNVWIVLLAAWFLSEPITRTRAAAIALAFAGCVLVML